MATDVDKKGFFLSANEASGTPPSDGRRDEDADGNRAGLASAVETAASGTPGHPPRIVGGVEDDPDAPPLADTEAFPLDGPDGLPLDDTDVYADDGREPPFEDPTLAFRHLGPDRLLDAIDAAGWITDGRISALNSYENRVYSVGLESGGFVVAKFYRPGRWSDAAILEEHAFCRALRERDLSVVAPLADADGRTLFHAGPFRLALYPRVGGRPPELDSPDQLHVVGRTLGRLHLVGDVYRFERRPRIGIARLGERSVNFLLDSPLLPPAVADVYESITAELLDVLDERFAATRAVPEISVHGDFHPGNILLGGDGVPQVLDFDDTGTGPAVQDLWMFVSGRRAYAQARLGDILDGYHEFREFDERELGLIEPLRTLRIIRHAAWIARRWDDPAFRQGFPQFGEARFWDEHVLALREQRAALDEPPLRY